MDCCQNWYLAVARKQQISNAFYRWVHRLLQQRVFYFFTQTRLHRLPGSPKHAHLEQDFHFCYQRLGMRTPCQEWKGLLSHSLRWNFKCFRPQFEKVIHVEVTVWVYFTYLILRPHYFSKSYLFQALLVNDHLTEVSSGVDQLLNFNDKLLKLSVTFSPCVFRKLFGASH